LASAASSSRPRLPLAALAFCCPNNCRCGTWGCRKCGGYSLFSKSVPFNGLFNQVADLSLDLKAWISAALHGGPPSPA
jgi:hypothetical protein